MNKRLRILVAAGMLMAFLLGPGLAAGEGKSPEINPPEIPVTVSTRGTPPAEAEEYTVRLTAEGSFPMPGGGSGGSYDLKVTGPVTGTFPAIRYDRVGIYTYTLRQVAGSHPGAAYDETVYEVKITVSNLPAGGFGYTTAIRKQGDASRDKVSAGFTVTYPAAKTDRTVIKVWDDSDQWGNENGDGIRPTELTATLMRGTERIDTVVLSAENGWTATVAGLDRFETDTRTEIVYTWTEGDVTEAYRQTGENTVTTAKAGGETADDVTAVTTITNSHTPETTSTQVIKQWDDDSDRDGLRPKGSDTLRVYLTAAGEAVTDGDGNAVYRDLTLADGWRATVSGLPKYRAGQEIAYQWVERETDWPEGYRLYAQSTVKMDGIRTTTLVNRHETDAVELTAVKVWDDAENQDGIRPATIDVRLLANGQPARDRDGNVIGNRGIVTLSGETDPAWRVTVGNLPKNDQGMPVTYTWEEVTRGLPGGYTFVGQETSGSVTVLTNRHVPETAEITIRKIWDDNDNQDGLRTAVRLRIIGTAEGSEVSREPSILITPEGETEHTFTMPAYHAGRRITYTVEEDGDTVPEGYEKTVDNRTMTVTNSHTPWTVDIPVEKIWDDAENQDGFRAATTITLTGTAGGETVVTRTLDIAADAEGDGLKTVFTGLPVRYQGSDIVYSVSEERVDRYDAPACAGSAATGFTVTNRHAPEQITISGQKLWEDANNQDGMRPESITVHLMANGTEVRRATVGEADGWAWRFENVDKYADGAEIEYTLGEDRVAAYEAPAVNGTGSIVNRHAPETVDAAVRKIWNDADNQDGMRPESLTVTLLADGEPVTDGEGNPVTRTLSEANSWMAEAAGLPKYKVGGQGHALTYSWSEPDISGYDGAESRSADGRRRTSVLTNTHPTLKTVATVTKVWDDADDQDGIRPASLTLRLMADGAETGITVTLTAEKGWTDTATGLDLYAAGRKIVYTWEEETPEGYRLTDRRAEGTTVTLVNSHTPETLTLSGRKIWDDADNQDGFRPESVTVLLKADRVQLDTAEVSGETEWRYSFTDLPKYRDHGTEIAYTVEEGAVAQYTAAVTETGNGYDITNTHTPEQTAVSVRKVWDDADNQDGVRPGSVVITLMADGAPATGAEGSPVTAELSEENGWSFTFENLPKRKAGAEIVYTAAEARVTGYGVPVVTGTANTGYTVTNTRIPDVLDLDVYKVWDDDDNRDGLRPAAITVNLLRNGAVYRTAILSAPTAPGADTNIWTYRFTDLPRNTDGVTNVYTLQEAGVDGYAGVITGYTVTNYHTPAVTARSVRKVWAGDAATAARTRPGSVTVTLNADGAPARDVNNNIIRATLSEANGWEATVTDLPVYENGRAITYRWTEEDVPGYELTGSVRVPTAAGETTTLTNTRRPAYNLTVYYLYLDTGETAAPPVEETHDAGDPYDIVSPEIEGYVTLRLRVTGTMPARDVVEYVYYYTNEIILGDLETPLGIGQTFINVGDCLE